MALSPVLSESGPGGRERKQHGTAMLPAACYLAHPQTDDISWHWHEQLEIMLVTEGQVHVAVGSEEFTLVQGQGLFINTGVLHTMWSMVESSLCSSVFHARFVAGSDESVLWTRYLDPLMANASLPCLLLDGLAQWHAAALQAFQKGWEACRKGTPGYEFELRNGLSQVIRLICTHQASAAAVLSPKGLRSWQRMKAMLGYITAHLAEELTVENIAAAATISRSECLRCFKQTIGESPIQYVLQLRVQKAASFLQGSDMPVNAIGRLCGFEDMSYFARTFKARKGCTPQEYRTQQRKATD